MIFKFFFISLLVSCLITASDPFFGIEISLDPIPKAKNDDVIERKWMSTDAFKPYIMDHDNRVSDLFEVSPFYYPNVNFWFLVYTQFDSSSVIIHDSKNLSLIYQVLDFSSLIKKKLSKNTRYILQQRIADDKIAMIKTDLDNLSKDPYSLTSTAKNIYRILKQANIVLPVSRAARSLFFSKLRLSIRSQTGQKNFIRDGVIRSLPYQNFLTKYFNDKKLPRELLAVSFLESSFNPRAHSKVNALGVWQFMPLIASFYVPKRFDNIDYRSNIGVASLAAAFLMHENFKIMKSWDLAVTAYNSGPKHLLRTKRKLSKKVVSLEDIINHSDSENFGFASKNFYSEFLALAHTLAYREEIFNEIHIHDREDVNKDLRFYITKCSLHLPRILDNKLLDDIHFHNHHISDLQHKIPKEFILTTKSSLGSDKFYSLTYQQLLSIKPKDWGKLLKNHSCSTK